MPNPTWIYVAAVYALAIWLARRGGVEIRWRIAAFFYLIVLLFLFRPMSQAYVNLPVDFLRTLPPWAYLTHDYKTANPEMNDVVLQIVPWAHQVRESWKAFGAPLWNPFSDSGYVLLANGQSSALSLVRFLALPLPLGYAFTAEAAWKLLIALTFTFLYCRRRGYSELASGIGAIAFGFCTFLIVWLHFPLVTVACFLPAVLYAIDLLIERITYRRFLFATLLWTVMIFGGHPETVSHAFFLALLYVGWILLIERPFTLRDAIRFVMVLGAALAIAGLLSLPFLAPFAEAVTKSKRYQELQASPNAIGYYSDWPSIIVLLQPHFSGRLPAERPWLPATAESITGFAGALGIGAWLILLVDVIMRRRFRSREAFFVVATVIVVGIFLAWPGISTLFHLIFKLAANARLRLLFCLLLAIQTAAAVDLVQQRRFIAWYAGVLASGSLLLYLIFSTQYPGEAERATAIGTILPSASVLVAALLVPLFHRWRDLALMVVATLLIGELWAVDRGWNPVLPAEQMYPETPLLRAMAELKAKQPANAPFRIVGTGPVFFPNVSTVFGLEDIRAHDPMANGRYLGVLRVVSGYNTDDYFAKWENLESPLLDALGVKYVITPPKAELPDPSRFVVVYDGKDGRIFENRNALPRFYTVPNVILEFRDPEFVRRLTEPHNWSDTALLEKLDVESDQMRTDFLAPRPPNAPKATMEIVSATPTDYRLHVRAPRWSLVVSSIPWWSGWKIERFGRRAEPIRVNGGFLAFAVPPGETDVRVTYDPWSWRVGVGVALLVALGLVAWPLSRLRERTARAAGR